VLSTHYLQEVEKSCSRVIIVNHGIIVADGTQEELLADQPAGGLRLHVRGPDAAVRAQLTELLPNVRIELVSQDDQGCNYRIFVDKQAAPIDESVARTIVKNGWDLLAMYRERPSLEDVFRKLTIASEAPEKVAPEDAVPQEASNG
jgi:ABC-2 type transport system ATP-binding protein